MANVACRLRSGGVSPVCRLYSGAVSLLQRLTILHCFVGLHPSPYNKYVVQSVRWCERACGSIKGRPCVLLGSEQRPRKHVVV